MINKLSLKKLSFIINPFGKKKDQEYIKALNNRKSMLLTDTDEKNRLLITSSNIPNNYDEV